MSQEEKLIKMYLQALSQDLLIFLAIYLWRVSTSEAFLARSGENNNTDVKQDMQVSRTVVVIVIDVVGRICLLVPV